MKSSRAGSDTAPVSPARSQVTLVGTSSASWLKEPFHLKHSSSQTAPIQSARPQETSQMLTIAASPTVTDKPESR